MSEQLLEINMFYLCYASAPQDLRILCFRYFQTCEAILLSLFCALIYLIFAVLTLLRTSTDVCSLLKTGYPRQSAAFVKIAGVRTNFSIPDVHSIALGGGSLVRNVGNNRISVGPDSVGARLENEALAFGGQTLTVRLSRKSFILG